MFYLTTHSTHFIYGYMVKDHSDSEKGNPLPPHRLLLSINRERKNAVRKNLTPGELKTLRERTLTAVKKYRVGTITDGTQQIQRYKYGNSASLNKAKSRVLKALPKHPRKRATVLKALACDILGGYPAKPRTTPKKE